MTLILLIFAAVLTVLLARYGLRQREETTALAPIECTTNGQSKEHV